MTHDDGDDRVIDRLLDGSAPADAEEEEARAPYRRLLGQMDVLAARARLPGLGDRIDARLRQERARERRLRRLVIVGGAIAAAAAVLFVAWPRAAGDPPALTMRVVHADGTPQRGGAPAVDDVVQLDLRAREPEREVRVYRDGALVARCPGRPDCRITAGGVHLDVRLDAPGTYRFVAITGRAAIPAPGATFDTDEFAARDAHLRFDELGRLQVVGR